MTPDKMLSEAEILPCWYCGWAGNEDKNDCMHCDAPYVAKVTDQIHETRLAAEGWTKLAIPKPRQDAGRVEDDTARLDYLEKIGPLLSVCKMPYYENKSQAVLQAPGWGTSRWNISSNEGSATQSGDTLRAAIDSSMSATLPGREFFFSPPTEECPYCKTVVQNEWDMKAKLDAALTLEAKPQPQDHLHSGQDGHWQIFYDGDNPDCPLCEVKEAKSAKEGV